MPDTTLTLYIYIAIIAIYSYFALRTLGTLSSPQTFAETGKIITFNTEKYQKVDIISVYIGIGKGSFQIQYWTGSKWENYGTYERKHGDCFTWRVHKVDFSAKFFSIVPTEGSKLTIGEIGLFADGKQIPIINANDPKVCDEQKTVKSCNEYTNSIIFDELYHPRTAYEIIHKMPVYETTHPPLGKVIQGVGIQIFGMCPFGWRIMGTLFGIGILPAIFFLAKLLFNNDILALFAMFLIATDFMHYSLTRMGTIDSYPIFFTLLSFAFLYQYLLTFSIISMLLSGICFGLAVSCKWIGVYGASAILVSWVAVWAYNLIFGIMPLATFFAHFALAIVFYVAIPCIFYILSYVPQMRYDLHGKKPLQYIIDNNKHMFNYHKGITQPHGFGSKWYEWPINKLPLVAYTPTFYSPHNTRKEGNGSTIAIFGNPLLFTLGSICVLLVVFSIYGNIENFGLHNAIPSYFLSDLFIIVCLLSQYGPNIVIPRTMFIYHFFGSTPFLALAIASMVLRIYIMTSSVAVLVAIVSAISVISLGFIVYFWPVVSGKEVTFEKLKSLQWKKTWHFRYE